MNPISKKVGITYLITLELFRNNIPLMVMMYGGACGIGQRSSPKSPTNTDFIFIYILHRLPAFLDLGLCFIIV